MLIPSLKVSSGDCARHRFSAAQAGAACVYSRVIMKLVFLPPLVAVTVSVKQLRSVHQTLSL